MLLIVSRSNAILFVVLCYLIVGPLYLHQYVVAVEVNVGFVILI
jgi:hypothetical protein